MKNKLIICLIPAIGLVSCRKEDSSPTSVSISAVKVITMPLTDQGSSWDALPSSDADLYFKIENSQNVLYDHKPENRIENISAEKLPATLMLPLSYQLPLLDQAYTISFYDYDDYSGDDLVGRFSFNPDSYKDERPMQKILTNGDMLIEITFNWK